MCKLCPENSFGCTYNQEKSKIEIPERGCENEFYIDVNEQGDYCALCPSDIGCTKCETKFTCFEYKKDQCRRGFYKEGNKCPACDPTCYECADRRGKCTSCYYKSVLKDDQCFTCNEVVENCQECSLLRLKGQIMFQMW